jgi:hypothetical protein
MNLHALLPQRAAAFTLCLLAIARGALAEDSLGVQVADAVWNLHDSAQDVVRKSVKGYIEASQEGPPPDNGGKPFDLDYLQQIKQKNENLVNNLNTLKANQQKLLEIDTQLLQQLPPNDPRRAAIEAEQKTVANGISNTIKKRDEYKDALATSNNAVDKWKYGHGLTNDPPKPLKKKDPPESVQNSGNDDPGPSGPTGPSAPTGPVDPGPWTGGGGPPPPPPVTTGGGNLDAWKAKEAQLEADARNLGKMREQAVIDYLNDPSDENKAKAAALKGQLDGMVNKLNKVRGKVDGLTGGSRSPLKVKTAKQIKNKWKQGGMTAGSGEDHHHGPDGTDMSGSGSGSEGHHHGADGQDVPNNYVSDGSAGSSGAQSAATGTGKRAGKRGGNGTGKRRQGGQASAGGHHHGPDGMDMPNNQARGQGGGKRQGAGNGQGQKRRMAAAQQTRQAQQTNPANYNLATNQNQAQNLNQQRRRKRQR